MSHNPGYPCDAAAGSVTFSAKTGATTIPAARIEKTVTSFLGILYLIGVGWNHGCTGFHRNVLRFGNVAVTKHSHFWSTIPRTVAMLLGNERCYAFLDRTHK